MIDSVQAFMSGLVTGLFVAIVGLFYVLSDYDSIKKDDKAIERESEFVKSSAVEKRKKEISVVDMKLIASALAAIGDVSSFRSPSHITDTGKIESIANKTMATTPPKFDLFQFPTPTEQLLYTEKILQDILREWKDQERSLKLMATYFSDLGKSFHSISKDVLKATLSLTSHLAKAEIASLFDEYWMAFSNCLESLALGDDALADTLTNDITIAFVALYEEHCAHSKRLQQEATTAVTNMKDATLLHESRSKDRDKWREKLTSKMDRADSASADYTKEIHKLEASEALLLEQTTRLSHAQRELAETMPRVISDCRIIAQRTSYAVKTLLLRFSNSIENARGKSCGIITMQLRAKAESTFRAIDVITRKSLGETVAATANASTAAPTNASRATSNATPDESSGAAFKGLDMSGEFMSIFAATSPLRLPELPPSFNDAVGSETCVWFNAFTGRIYRDIDKSDYFHHWFCEKTSNVLNKGPKPGFVDDFTVDEVVFGALPPLLSNIRWIPVLTPPSGSGPAIRTDFDVVCNADMSFQSGIKLKISTKLWCNWPRDRYAFIPVTITLEVVEICGPIRFGVDRGSSFLSFLQEPRTRFKVHSEVGAQHFKLTDIPKLSEVIIKKIREHIRKKVVYPNSHRFKLMWPRTWWPEGLEHEFLPVPLKNYNPPPNSAAAVAMAVSATGMPPPTTATPHNATGGVSGSSPAMSDSSSPAMSAVDSSTGGPLSPSDALLRDVRKGGKGKNISNVTGKLSNWFSNIPKVYAEKRRFVGTIASGSHDGGEYSEVEGELTSDDISTEALAERNEVMWLKHLGNFQVEFEQWKHATQQTTPSDVVLASSNYSHRKLARSTSHNSLKTTEDTTTIDLYSSQSSQESRLLKSLYAGAAMSRVTTLQLSLRRRSWSISDLSERTVDLLIAATISTEYVSSDVIESGRHMPLSVNGTHDYTAKDSQTRHGISARKQASKTGEWLSSLRHKALRTLGGGAAGVSTPAARHSPGNDLSSSPTEDDRSGSQASTTDYASHETVREGSNEHGHSHFELNPQVLKAKAKERLLGLGKKFLNAKDSIKRGITASASASTVKTDPQSGDTLVIDAKRANIGSLSNDSSTCFVYVTEATVREDGAVISSSKPEDLGLKIEMPKPQTRTTPQAPSPAPSPMSPLPPPLFSSSQSKFEPIQPQPPASTGSSTVSISAASTGASHSRLSPPAKMIAKAETWLFDEHRALTINNAAKSKAELAVGGTFDAALATSRSRAQDSASPSPAAKVASAPVAPSIPAASAAAPLKGIVKNSAGFYTNIKAEESSAEGSAAAEHNSTSSSALGAAGLKFVSMLKSKAQSLGDKQQSIIKALSSARGAHSSSSEDSPTKSS